MFKTYNICLSHHTQFLGFKALHTVFYLYIIKQNLGIYSEWEKMIFLIILLMTPYVFVEKMRQIVYTIT